MKNFFTGFSMAWGNFCILPCPIKKWNSRCQSLMLGFLPFLGAVIGIIWALVYFGLVYLSVPFLATSFISAFIPFGLCGFMHLDGFMDCSDAILSRRPLEDRQRILKDSHTGAFAVISLAFLILGFYAFISTAISSGIDFANLIMITLVSRTVSGLCVLCSKPMETSQYNQYSENANISCSEKPVSKACGVVLLLVLFLIFVSLCFVFSSNRLSSLITLSATGLGAFIFVSYAKHSLGGMNGDIAGYGIVWGEFFGVISLAFL